MRSELIGDPILAGAPEMEGFKVLDPVVLYQKLGEGGMGAVYRGHHLKLDIPVALKCLKPVIAQESPDLIPRFRREATVAASLDSENLVRVFDVHRCGEIHYLLMEYVAGETIRQRIDRLGPLEPELAVSVVFEAARGLVQAHERGIVHRDIKPDNIIISDDGRIKVTDLGLAKLAQGSDALKTRSGVVMGTPNYMPPEQYRDASTLSASADVYALGLTLFYMLTGRSAVESGSLVEVLRRVCEDDLPDLDSACPGLPPGLANAFRLATQKDAAARPQSAREFMGLIGPYRMRRGWRQALSRMDDEDSSATKRAVLEATAAERETIRTRLREGPSSSSNEVPETLVGAGQGSTVPPTLAPQSTPDGRRQTDAVLPTAHQETGSGRKTSRLVLGGALLGILLFGVVGAVWKFDLLGRERDRQEERFRQGVADLRGSATLDRGVNELLELKAEDEDFPGLADELGPALVVLAQRLRDDDQLGRAWRMLEEARDYREASTLASLDAELREAIELKLRRALSVASPDPEKGQLTDNAILSIEGSVDVDRLLDRGIDDLSLEALGEEAKLVGGAYRASVKLSEGKQVVPVVLRAFGEIEHRVELGVTLDTQAPRLYIDNADEDVFSRKTMVSVGGRIEDSADCKVQVEVVGRMSKPQVALVKREGEEQTWSARVALIEGSFDLRVTAIDPFQRKAEANTIVKVDLVAPSLNVGELPTFVESATHRIEGRAKDAFLAGCTLRGPLPNSDREALAALTGTEISTDESGSFRAELKLQPGENHFLLTASDQAGRSTEIALELRRETAKSWSRRARVFAADSNFVKAREMLARAKRIDGQARDPRRLEPLLAICTGDIDTGRQELTQFLAREGTESALISDRAVANWYAEARTAKAGSLPSSKRIIAEFERALQLDANNLAAKSNLGVLRVLAGEAEAGETLCREAVNARPSDVAMRHALGWVQQVRGRPREAIVHYDLALAGKNPYVPTLLNRGEALIADGRRPEGMKDLGFALPVLAKRKKSGPPLFPPLRITADAEGEPALVITPEVVSSYSLSQVLTEAARDRHLAGSYSLAISYFDSIKSPDKAAQIARVESLVASALKSNLDRAAAEVGRLLARKDLNLAERKRLSTLRAAALLDSVYRSAGVTKAPGAMAKLDRAVLDAYHPGPLMTRARGKLNRKDWKGAAADLDRVLKMEPNNAEAYYLRSTARSWLDDWSGYQRDALAAYARNPVVGDDLKERLDGWFVVMRKETGPLQSYSLPATWPPAKDPQDLASVRQGRAVSQLVKGRYRWTVLHEKPGAAFQQVIRRAKVFPQDWVKERWQERYQIRAVAWTGSEVVVVMRKTAATNTWRQSYVLDDKIPVEWIKTKAKENYRLNLVAQVSKTQRIFVMDRPDGYRHPGQSWKEDPDFPRSFLNSRRAESYHPEVVIHDDKGWFAALIRLPAVKDHRVFAGRKWPQDAVKKAWTEGFRIQTISYGPDFPVPSPYAGDPYALMDRGDLNGAKGALQARISNKAEKQKPYLLFRRMMIALRQGKKLDEVRRQAIMNRAWSAPFLDEWSRAIMDYFAGDRDEAGLLKLAAKNKERLCEAHYYIASIRRAQGDPAGARRYLQRCVDQKVTNFTEHKSAVIELRQK